MTEFNNVMSLLKKMVLLRPSISPIYIAYFSFAFRSFDYFFLLFSSSLFSCLSGWDSGAVQRQDFFFGSNFGIETFRSKRVIEKGIRIDCPHFDFDLLTGEMYPIWKTN